MRQGFMLSLLLFLILRLRCKNSQLRIRIVISRDGSAKKDIENRLSKARNAFANLRPVKLSSLYNIRTKLHLYSSIVESVLSYGLECWQVVETNFYKIEAFQNGCLRMICRIFWPRTILNLLLYAKINYEPFQLTIKNIVSGGSDMGRFLFQLVK